MKRYIISILCLTILFITGTQASVKSGLKSWKHLFGNSHADSVRYQVEKYNTKQNLTKPCDDYNDCYNCTLSACKWENNVCEKKDVRFLNIYEFFKEGSKCEDTKNYCDSS